MKKTLTDEQKKKRAKLNLIILAIFVAIILLMIIIAIVCDSNSDSNSTHVDYSENVQVEDSAQIIEFGELVNFTESADQSNNYCVIKAKITSSYNNEATINQNYYNIEYFIENAGGAEYDSIQYWAVADMSDGSETKVISFTVPKKTIELLANGDISANQLEDYVEDLYIHQSLQN